MATNTPENNEKVTPTVPTVQSGLAVPVVPVVPITPVPAASNSNCSSPIDIGAEIARYILYGLCFIFGVLAWGVIADKLLISGVCIGFGDLDIGFTTFTYDGSPLCAVVIAFGVIMTVILLAAVVWHSLIFFERPFLPFLVEGIVFSSMGLLWLSLGISAIATSPEIFRKGLAEVRVVIAGAWMAGFLHLAVGVLAFAQAKTAANGRDSWKNGSAGGEVKRPQNVAPVLQHRNMPQAAGAPVAQQRVVDEPYAGSV